MLTAAGWRAQPGSMDGQDDRSSKRLMDYLWHASPPSFLHHVCRGRTVGAFLGLWMVALLSMAAAAHAAQPSFIATVTSVLAGDTLVARAGQRELPLRLLGIDTPAVAEPFGALARERTAQLVLGQRVTVYPIAEDPGGRTLAVVQLADGRDLGRVLLADGLARWDRQKVPDANQLAKDEAAARTAGRGLWGAAVQP